jgi:glycosyltransferase involved in cell wall biosynthesis
LQRGTGVIVHSNHAIDLARTWYGDSIRVLMRKIPFLPFPAKGSDRRAARQRLDLPQGSFVVCSFGLLTPAKLSDRLLEAWLNSPMAEQEECHLIFVGANDCGDYGERLAGRIAETQLGSRIRITGYTEEPEYRDYLAAADLAVQLRTRSRGETSAALFDCLSRNVPVIVNAHGSSAEIPDEVVIKLDDHFTNDELSAALVRSYTDVELRRKLVVQGALYIDRIHHPERVAEFYRDTIEELYTTNAQAQEQELMRVIARTSATQPTEADLKAVAVALTGNRQRFGPAQLLVDVTNIARFDLLTGIERVTRGILMALLANPPSGYRIEPVRAVSDRYLYARRFMCERLDLPDAGLPDEMVAATQGDIFLGLDWSVNMIPGLLPWFETLKRRGVRLVFTIYDMLPLLRPLMFPPEIEPMTRDWLNALVAVAEGLVCISRTVADELVAHLDIAPCQRLSPLRVGFFHLGADLHASLPSDGLDESSARILADVRQRPSFLMVGTVEPRKGHQQALAAMELLWESGMDVNLVIVGKKGWMMDDLIDRIQQHPENNSRLFWLPGISDEMLDQVYRGARALLAASTGEGFGLPLIEAAQYGVPIIARDIPVFREVAGESAYYFRGEDADSLANALHAWLACGDAVPRSVGIQLLSWHDSSRQLLDILIRDKWYRSWPEPLRATL